jgi:hypothetical protein
MSACSNQPPGGTDLQRSTTLPGETDRVGPVRSSRQIFVRARPRLARRTWRRRTEGRTGANYTFATGAAACCRAHATSSQEAEQPADTFAMSIDCMLRRSAVAASTCHAVLRDHLVFWGQLAFREVEIGCLSFFRHDQSIRESLLQCSLLWLRQCRQTCQRAHR